MRKRDPIITITPETHAKLKNFSLKSGMKMGTISDRAVNDYLNRMSNPKDQAAELRKIMEGK